MRCCWHCGALLEERFLPDEGMVPYCPNCKEYRFPIFSTAVSMVIINKRENKTLFIKQYGTSFNRLVAGYINKGEAAEEAVVREMNEEIGISPISIKPQITRYFEKSNTLIINFLCEVDTIAIKPNHEVDSYSWYDIEEAKDKLEGARLAGVFYNYYLNNRN